jgi:signal transduction histidine kinase
MGRVSLSLTRTFALLSLFIIGLITAAQITVQWSLLKADLLDWERTVTVDAIRAAVYSRLSPGDVTRWDDPAIRARFEDVFARALGHLEIRRVKVYDAGMRVIWSDETRLLGARFADNADLAAALRGRTVAHLEQALKAENVYERHFGLNVELYVPLVFPGTAPGRVAAVVELYKSPSRALANLSHDRWVIVLTSLGGGVLLYAVLFGIVHRASRQLQVLQEQLRLAERMAAIGQMSAAVAHGIRNPLASIRAVAQATADQVGEQRAIVGALDTIVAEVDRLNRWLQDLLCFARPFEARSAAVDLSAVLDDALAVLADRIVRGEVKVIRHFAPDLPPVTADESQLSQAVLAVLENALDALGRGGSLTVETLMAGRVAPRAARVIIQDSGEGMSRERLARIFEPFFTTKTAGTGLGLAIARKVIEGHGGNIRVDSEPGIGTTVTMTLPLTRP